MYLKLVYMYILINVNTQRTEFSHNYIYTCSIATCCYCRLLFFTVNPGGWAPPSVVRTIAKRELTKFLKKFSSACHNRLNNTPLTL